MDILSVSSKMKDVFGYMRVFYEYSFIEAIYVYLWSNCICFAQTAVPVNSLDRVQRERIQLHYFALCQIVIQLHIGKKLYPLFITLPGTLPVTYISYAVKAFKDIRSTQQISLYHRKQRAYLEMVLYLMNRLVFFSPVFGTNAGDMLYCYANVGFNWTGYCFNVSFKLELILVLTT